MTIVRCPASGCGAVNWPQDRICAECGAPLPPIDGPPHGLVEAASVTESSDEATPTPQALPAPPTPQAPAASRLRVVHIAPDASVETHVLDDELVVGREEGDVALPEDTFLSRRHFSVRVGPEGCRLTDLDSTNGTYLRIREDVELRPGDQIRVGGQVFRFVT